MASGNYLYYDKGLAISISQLCADNLHNMAGLQKTEIKLGLQENWKQFTLLVFVNAFVGGMVGMERSILPQIAEQEFAIAAKTSAVSWIANRLPSMLPNCQM